MVEAEATTLLNRLLAIEYRSLPMYLRQVAPWVHRGDEPITTALDRIVRDQNEMAGRLSQLIERRGGTPELGSLRIEFTDMHFLSLDYLVERLIDEARRDIAAIERCVAPSQGDSEARELAEEVLGSERAHLEAFESLAKVPA